jgi:hypothetical protein
MDTNIESRLAEIEGKVDEMYAILKNMRFYSRLTFWVTTALIVGPLLLLPFVIPAFLSSLSLPSDSGTGTQSSANSADLTNLISQLGL